MAKVRKNSKQPSQLGSVDFADNFMLDVALKWRVKTSTCQLKPMQTHTKNANP
jgi:hypothetical protein